MRIGVAIVLYALEIFKYYLGYYICFNKKIRKKWEAVVGGMLFVVVMILGSGAEIYQMYLIMYASTICAMLFVIEEKWSIRISRIFIICFILICLNGVFRMLIDVAALKGEDYCIREVQQYLCGSLFTLGILAMIAILKGKIGDASIRRFCTILGEKMQYITVIMVFSMMLTIAGLNYARNNISNLSFTVYAVCICAVSYISVGMLGVFSIYIKNVNGRMAEIIKKEIALKNMQKCYYQALLEKEEDTRKYRHDMNNHLICLNAFANDGDILLLKEYIGRMQGQIEQIQRKCYVTGNKVLDVITNYYLAPLEKCITVHISGQVRKPLAASDVELCTIYANLLENAVEEAGRGEAEEGQFIEIQFQQGNKYFEMRIKNKLLNFPSKYF